MGGSKIATTYEECHKAKRETEKNDLYFYYPSRKIFRQIKVPLNIIMSYCKATRYTNNILGLFA